MRINDLAGFIDGSPTPFHAVNNCVKLLESEGYECLPESVCRKMRAGGKYYVTRNMSSLIAFRVPEKPCGGFMICASHCDSPAFKLKEFSGASVNGYYKLSVEGYGSMAPQSWLDRPLGVAGRVTVKDGCRVKAHIVDLPVTCIIPSVALHLTRKQFETAPLNPAVDFDPVLSCGGEEKSIKTIVSEQINVGESDILSAELTVYNKEKSLYWDDLISAPRIDDLQCAFASLSAFLASNAECGNVPVYALFDNEEVGSTTKQGAASTFLSDVLENIAGALGHSLGVLLKNGMMVSADNAHAVHPNHPELSDPANKVYINKGVVIKHNSNQKYTTDAVSAGAFRYICERSGVPVQDYFNRSDIPGGSTLGNISNSKVSLSTVDIGNAQLAMHSSFETAGMLDTAFMTKALTEFYSSVITSESDGTYIIK